MFRSNGVALTITACTLALAVAGCSGTQTPAPSSHSFAAGVQRVPQSLGSWTAQAPMPTAREGVAAGVINGILYAVGGTQSGFTALNTVEAYDPTTNSWSTKAPMPTARGYLGVGVVNGVLYAIGGANGDNLGN